METRNLLLAMAVLSAAACMTAHTVPPAADAHATAEPQPAAEEQPTAAALLQATREIYANCRTYRDEGEVSVGDGGEDQDATPFTTAFVRPRRFRCEYRSRWTKEDDWDQHVVWTDADGACSWSTNEPRVEVWDALDMPLASLQGFGGSASRVPGLLLSGRELAMQDARVIGEEQVDGVPCWRIRGLGDSCDVWLDAESHLIRRVVWESFTPQGFWLEVRTSYRPEIDVEISDAELSFEPPADNSRVRRESGPALLQDLHEGWLETYRELQPPGED